MEWPSYPNRDVSRLSNVKILIILPDEDLGEEDIVGLVLRFEAVAANGAAGAAEVAGFQGFVQRAEGGRNVLWELRAVLTASALEKLLRSRS